MHNLQHFFANVILFTSKIEIKYCEHLLITIERKKSNYLIQPTDGSVAKPKLRRTVPPKQQAKIESFQSIQLKPVVKTVKKSEKVENGTIELKVSRNAGDQNLYYLNLFFPFYSLRTI